MIAFNEELKEIISRLFPSKNQLIRDLGFDRSIFFKILSGDRLPTEEQFSLILHLIVKKGTSEDSIYKENPGLLQNDLDSLIVSYLSARLDSSSYQLWEVVRAFIVLTNRTISAQFPDETGTGSPSSRAHSEVSSAVETKVHDFIIRELSCDHAGLDFCLSPALIDRFGIYAFFDKVLPFHPMVRQILGLPAGENSLESISVMLRNFAQFVGLLDSDSSRLVTYCTTDSASVRKSDIFPYYLLGKDRLLLISDDGSSCAPVTDPVLIQEWHRRFESVIHSITPLFLPVDDYMGLAQELLILNKKITEIPVIFAADRPCFWQLVTPEIIERYTNDPVITAFGKEYARTIQSCPNFYTIFSPDGLKAFRKDCFISEAGLNLQLDDDDMKALDHSFMPLRDRQMIQIPFSGCLVRGWEIAVYSPDLAVIFPFSRPERTIRILNREMIRALFVFYNSLRKCCRLYD